MHNYWRDLFRRRTLHQELDEELRAHLDIETQHRMDEGEAPEAARTNALRAMRSLDFVKESTRDAWGWIWLHDVWHDLRHALWTVLRSPGFFVSALLILSFGIGFNLVCFQMVDREFWAPLPIPNPQSFLQLDWSNELSYPALDYLRSNNSVFSRVLASVDSGSLVRWENDDFGIPAAFVSSDWFEELNYRPLLVKAAP